MDSTSRITDLESAVNECSYTTLPDHHTLSEDSFSSSSSSSSNGFKPLKSFAYTFSIVLFFCSTVLVLVGDHQRSAILSSILPPTSKITPSSRGVSEGVSEKSNAKNLFSASNPFPWTNNMLSWQRTSYHFQPQRNWMNDPNGPLYYKGWYHFFYQYNPEGAVWGNIVWGHAVSKDLIHWQYLPIAMVPDQWYDSNGVWTGSATILPDGSLVMLYTGSTNESVQVQNLAYPADPNDPLLLEWVKYEKNPVLLPPPGIGSKDFRDPTTAWRTPNGNWKITIGSRLNTTLGMALVYETPDFINYKLKDGLLHAVPGTGEWECVDLYPVSTVEENGLDTSVNGPNVKHVLKASLDDDKNDYYALGVYDEAKDVWTPDNPELDVGIGLKYDYGHFYASKTFYDQHKQRRILWGWIGETDSERADIEKGWSSVQVVPREVTFDKKTKTNLIQWPVEEVEDLRLSSKKFEDVMVETGSVVHLDVDTATQVDITAEFEIDEKALEGVLEAGVGYNCSTSGGAAGRGALGPFGLLVLADGSRTEQTAVFFYIARGVDGNLNTFFCTDQSRSSKANDVNKQIYGSKVRVLKGEKLSVRVLVDHSIVEAFAQGGRTCITSRVYPTEAIYGASRVFLFNNATGVSVTAKKVKIWEMNSALLHPYNFSVASVSHVTSLYVLAMILFSVLINMYIF